VSRSGVSEKKREEEEMGRNERRNLLPKVLLRKVDDRNVEY